MPNTINATFTKLRLGVAGSVAWRREVVNRTRYTYYTTVKRERVTARRVPSSTAGLLQELELRQPRVVTGPFLAELTAATGARLTKAAAAERLVREGWLSPLRTRDAWEFVPASRAGRHPSGDTWIELRALLAHKQDAPVAVAFASAIWELGFSSHPPARATFAHTRGWRPPRSLGDARSVSYDWVLPVVWKDGLPLWQPATVVVAAADRPECQDDWGNADDWLPETLRATAPADLLIEARGRGAATLSRLGYFADWSGRDDIVEAVRPLLADRLPVTFLGPRLPRGRWVRRWRLYDSLLPSR